MKEAKKTICSPCRYYKYSEVSGSPWTYRWKCIRQDIMRIQSGALTEANDEFKLCFEPRQVPLWRVPVAVIIGLWVSVFLFFAIYFLGVGVVLASSGDFRLVPIVVPILVGIISIAIGLFGSIEWYKRRL